MIVFAVVVTTASAVAFSLQQSPLYQASADVYVRQLNVVLSSTGPEVTPNTQTADRQLETQALLAASNVVAERAAHSSGLNIDAKELLSLSSVSPKTNADFLHFSVESDNPDTAVTLANAYATAYATYRNELDAKSLEQPIAEIKSQIAALGVNADVTSPNYLSLQNQLQQYETVKQLVSNNATVAEKATDAPKVRPTPVKTGIIGGLFGVILGIGIAFLSNAVDTRVRSAEELTELLGLPLIARIAAPPKRLQRSNELAMLSPGHGVHAESYRKLRTNFDFANLRPQAEVVMITSALPQEGKSTTVANLAVALARSGRHVVLVDLDLRRPIIAAFFDLEDRLGLTDVALGETSLESALVPIEVADPDRPRPRDEPFGLNGGEDIPRRLAGVLEVLPAGSIPPDPGEFVGNPKLAEILHAVHERADVVLLDAPPLLAVSDGMTLSSLVDGMLIVARANIVRRPMMTELRRVLQTAPCAKLGFVLTNAEADEQYGYEHGYGYGYTSPPTERTSEPAEIK